MTNTDSAVRVRGLRKSYAGRPAVAGLDLDIGVGEVFALLGPNGAGKTTTVELLTGYRKPDAGQIEVLGRDPSAAGRQWRARIGVVPQVGRDLGELTVREVVSQFCAYFPAPADPEQVIAAVGLTGQAGVRLGQLSGGQRRRVDVAIGIAGRPELLFLDEPTTGFDPQARRKFWELIRDLAATGTTILLTTHYLDEAEVLANRVAVLNAGRVVAEGTPAELGGRAAATATVRWQGGDGDESVCTASPTRLVIELAHQHNGEIPGLSVSRPSLEDVYLDLIGALS